MLLLIHYCPSTPLLHQSTQVRPLIHVPRLYHIRVTLRNITQTGLHQHVARSPLHETLAIVTASALSLAQPHNYLALTPPKNSSQVSSISTGNVKDPSPDRRFGKHQTTLSCKTPVQSSLHFAKPWLRPPRMPMGSYSHSFYSSALKKHNEKRTCLFSS